MRAVDKLRLRLRSLLTPRQVEAELDRELRFHLDQEIDENVAAGMTREEARRAALRAVGQPAGIKEACRDTRGLGVLETAGRDLYYAIRSMRKSPGFAAAALLTVTLGIGVNTAIFSVVNAVLLTPIPYFDPDTLVAIENTSNGTPYGPWTSPAKFMYWREQTGVFSDLAAIDPYPRYLNYTGGDAPEQVTVSRVSEGYFRVLRAPITRGRGFTAEEDLPGGPGVAVISYDFWQRRLGGAQDALGRILPLSGDSYTIVGILDEDFTRLDPYFDAASSDWNADLLVPFQLEPVTREEAHFFVNIARLAPGVTLAEARARLEASAAGFRQRFPAMPETESFTVRQAGEVITTMLGDPRTRLWVLAGAVGLVLLIACANVASLLLVRATGRSHEIAIRSALGAGRGRIVRQLLTESLLLSLVGGVLGLGTGILGIRALLAVNTAGLPRLGSGGELVSVDWRVVAFTLALSVATGLVFGLAPALVGSRTDLNTVMKNSGGRSTSGVRPIRARSVLIAVEVGLAVVLLIGASLLIRTSLALGRVDPGFDSSGVLAMRTMISASRFRTSESAAETVRAGLERVRSLPGVESAGVTGFLPPGGAMSLPFDIVGRPDDTASSTGSAGYVPSSEGYFAALGIPVIRGRTFTARDDEAAAPAVAVINQAMAERFWTTGQDALDDPILIGAGIRELAGGPVRRIVGIVGNTRHGGLDREPAPTMYVPVSQVADPVYALITQGDSLAWVVRTRGDLAVSATAIQDSIREATGVPVVDVQPMDRVLSDSVSRQRLNMLLMSVFGGAALLLAAIGIYGIMAYSVDQRVLEIGIRMALGGDARRVKGMVVRQGMLPVIIGTAAGLVAAFYAADVLASFLFGVEPRDPVVFVAVPAVLALIAIASVWLPARRAGRVNPLDALRHGG